MVLLSESISSYGYAIVYYDANFLYIYRHENSVPGTINTRWTRVDGTMTQYGNFVPDGASTRNLGSATADWANLYIGTGRTYYAADQAESIYSDTNNLILVSGGDVYIDEAGNNLRPNNSNDQSLGSASAEWLSCYIGTRRYYMSLDQGENIRGSANTMIFAANAVDELILTSAELRPNADAGLNLGTTSVRFGTGYFDNIDINNLQLPIADPASDHDYVGVTVTETAGEALAIGDLCYRKSDGKFWKAAISAEASGVFLVYGKYRDDSWTWTDAQELYISVTPGNPTGTRPSATGDIVRIAAHAHGTTMLFFNPSQTYIELT